jgi:hypothetical protein
VSAASGLKAFWLRWFSRPKSDRALYRLIHKRKPRKMMLLGLGDAQRALRMIWLAQRYQAADTVHFAAIDRFDSRPVEVPHFTLKAAHKLLRPTGSRINLIPGDPLEGLGRAVNVLYGFDLVVISADQDAASMNKSWFCLQRLLAPQAVVFQEEFFDGRLILKLLSPLELQRLAAASMPARRRAA